MFAARNLQKHCLKTLSSLLQSNPNRNVVAFKDTAPKLISSNVIRLDGCFEDNFASFPSFTDPFNGWFRMMSTSRGRSMRSKVERRMQKESGNASSIEEPCKIRVKYGRQYNRHRLQWCSKLGGFFCTCLVKEDCCKVEDLLQQQSGEEDALFCTLCNAEWLNNCVGRKNYISFVCLMAASLVRVSSLDNFWTMVHVTHWHLLARTELILMCLHVCMYVVVNLLLSLELALLSLCDVLMIERVQKVR